MPGIQCVVAFCKSNAILKKETGERYSFHKFPKDDKLRKKWIRFCRRERSFNADTSCICSKHFTKEDFENSEVECSIKELLNMDVKMRLKTTACPSILILKAEHRHEKVELIHERRRKKKHHNVSDSSDQDNAGGLDLQIVSKRDLQDLTCNYLSLKEEHEQLQKKYKELKEVYRSQKDKLDSSVKQEIKENDYYKKKKLFLC